VVQLLRATRCNGSCTSAKASRSRPSRWARPMP